MRRRTTLELHSLARNSRADRRSISCSSEKAKSTTTSEFRGAPEEASVAPLRGGRGRLVGRQLGQLRFLVRRQLELWLRLRQLRQLGAGLGRGVGTGSHGLNTVVRLRSLDLGVRLGGLERRRRRRLARRDRRDGAVRR